MAADRPYAPGGAPSVPNRAGKGNQSSPPVRPPAGNRPPSKWGTANQPTNRVPGAGVPGGSGPTGRLARPGEAPSPPGSPLRNQGQPRKPREGSGVPGGRGRSGQLGALGDLNRFRNLGRQWRSGAKGGPQSPSGGGQESRARQLARHTADVGRKAGTEVAARGLQSVTGIPPALSKPFINMAIKHPKRLILLVVLIFIASVFVVLLAISLVLGGIASIFSDIGAPPPSSVVQKEIPATYLSAYEAAASTYNVPWTILAGIGVVQTDSGRFSPYDWVDYPTQPTPIDRDPGRTVDPWCANEVALIVSQAPKSPGTSSWQPCSSVPGAVASGSSVPGTPVSGVPSVSPYACAGSTCGVQPPIGTRAGEGKGPYLLLSTSQYARSGINPQDITQVVPFVARKLAALRTRIVASGQDQQWNSNASQANSLWTTAVDDLYASGVLAPPSGQAQSCTATAGGSVRAEIEQVWTCEANLLPALYVVTGITYFSSSGAPSFQTVTGQAAVNSLVSEALAVAKATSDYGKASCSNTQPTSGVFPLTAPEAAAFGDTNRCNQVQNIDAAARAVFSIEQLPISARQSVLTNTLRNFGLPGAAGPVTYEPMLGGWMLLPGAFGSQEPQLLANGPFRPFVPTTSCQAAVNSWISSLLSLHPNPFTPFGSPGSSVPGPTQIAAINQQLVAASVANPALADPATDPAGGCSGGQGQAAYYSFLASQVRALVTSGSLPGTSQSPASVPGTAVHSSNGSSLVPGQSLPSPSGNAVQSSSPTSSGGANLSAPAAGLVAFFTVEANSPSANPGPANYPSQSAISRLSLDGVGVSFNPPSPQALLVNTAAPVGSGTSVVLDSIQLGGDYPGATPPSAGSGAPGTSVAPSAVASQRIPATMIALYQQAAASQCPGMSWTLEAAVGTIETDNGLSTLPGVHSGSNSAGAEGIMQFEPSTWSRYENPAPPGGTVPPSPYNAPDAVYAAARYLCSLNIAKSPYNAFIAYNCGNIGQSCQSASAGYATEAMSLALSYAGSHGGSSSLAAIASAAESQVGLPYIWGGEQTGVGFDCSGLVDYALSQAHIDPGGVPLGSNGNHGATSEELYAATQASRVSTNSLVPGDLLFFEEGPSGPGHVGVYIGGGMMVDAPHTGANVRIESWRWSTFFAATNPNPSVPGTPA